MKLPDNKSLDIMWSVATSSAIEDKQKPHHIFARLLYSTLTNEKPRVSIMTHHDLIIDTIVSYLYESYKDGEMGESWSSENAEKYAQLILEAVEEFQQKRSELKKSTRWRASD